MTRADHMAQMENVFGIFVHHQNDMDMDGVANILTEHAVLDMQDIGLYAEGSQTVYLALRDYYDKEKAAGYRTYHIPHNLCVKQDEEDKGMIYAETHSFQIDQETGSVQMFCMRYDMTLSLDQGRWKIAELRWYALQYFEPVPGSAGEMVLNDPAGFHVLETQITGGDHIAIQNLLGKYCIWNRRGAEELFADSAEVTICIPGLTDEITIPDLKNGKERATFILDRIAANELANQNCYLAIPYLGAPVIDTEGDQAEGWWMSHTYLLRSSLYQKGGREEMVRKIERFHCTFVREGDCWKILSLEVISLAQFPPVVIDREMHGQTPVWDGQDHWPLPPVYETENHADRYPEDVYHLQRIFPEWGLRLRRAEMRQTPDLIFISDQDRMDIDINIRRNIGLANNLPRLQEFDENCRPHETTSHNTSSPYFYINDACNKAEISWFDESWTNMNAVFKRSDDPVHFMVNLGEYRFTFEKENGQWKVQRIWWRVLYRLPDLMMDREPPCFCNRDQKHIWPMPFETVHY